MIQYVLLLIAASALFIARLYSKLKLKVDLPGSDIFMVIEIIAIEYCFGSIVRMLFE